MKKLLILFSLFFYSLNCHAGSWYFFEPGIGFYQGHYQTNKVSGIGFDFKLGVNWDKMYIGADVGYATGLNVSSVAYDLDMNNTGVVIGFNTANFRLWYTIMTGANNSYKSGAVDYKATGKGSKIGMGGKVSGNMYFNLEINFLKYDELSTDGTLSDVDQFMDLALISFSWLI